MAQDRLEQLVAQRHRYELARRSATDPVVEARHAANVARLDGAIEAERRMRDTDDPSVSLPSRPCIESQGSACELSGRYDKVRWSPLRDRFAAIKATIPGPVWVALFVALIVGLAITSLGVMLEPSLARAASRTPATDVASEG